MPDYTDPFCDSLAACDEPVCVVRLIYKSLRPVTELTRTLITGERFHLSETPESDRCLYQLHKFFKKWQPALVMTSENRKKRSWEAVIELPVNMKKPNAIAYVYR